MPKEKTQRKESSDLDLVDGLLVLFLPRLEQTLGVVNHLFQTVFLLENKGLRSSSANKESNAAGFQVHQQSRNIRRSATAEALRITDSLTKAPC